MTAPEVTALKGLNELIETSSSFPYIYRCVSSCVPSGLAFLPKMRALPILNLNVENPSNSLGVLLCFYCFFLVKINGALCSFEDRWINVMRRS